MLWMISQRLIALAPSATAGRGRRRHAADDGAGTLLIEDLSLGKKKGVTRAQTQFIRFANRGATTLCLDGYRMDTQGLTYWFPSGTCLAPGATFTLHGGDIAPEPTGSSRVSSGKKMPKVFAGWRFVLAPPPLRTFR